MACWRCGGVMVQEGDHLKCPKCGSISHHIRQVPTQAELLAENTRLKKEIEELKKEIVKFKQ